MVELYPPESIHQEDPQQLLAADTYFIGAYLERKLLGIGAVKHVDASPAYGEIKNLFVDRRFAVRSRPGLQARSRCAPSKLTSW